jgi:hypothetical protein
LKKYLFNKYTFWVFAALIAAVLALSAQFFSGRFIPAVKHSLEEGLRDYFGKDTSVRGIAYHFPGSIIIKGLLVKNWGVLPSGCGFSAEKVKIDFSLINFLSAKNFSVSKISFYRPVLTTNGYSCLPTGTRVDFSRLASRNSKFGSLVIVVKQGRFIFGGSRDICLGIDGVFKYHPVKGLFSQGKVYLDKVFDYSRQGKGIAELPLTYEFNGYFNKEGIAVERLELKFEKIYSKFWGALDDSVLRLNGFIRLSDFLNFQKIKKNPDSKINGKDNLLFTPVVSSNLDIYDFDCLVRLDPGSIDIQKLSGTVNGMPLDLKGGFSFGQNSLLKFRLSSFSRQPRDARLTNPKAFDLSVYGNLSAGLFNGKIVYGYSSSANQGLNTRKIYAGFKNLSLDIASGRQAKWSFDNGIFYYFYGIGRSGFQLQDFKAEAKIEDSGLNIGTINARLYGGTLKGKGDVDFGFFPFRSNFELWLDNVNLKNAVSFSDEFPHVWGILDADFVYGDYPWEKAKGSFTIRDGGISGLSFFKWLCRSFEIKEFDSLDFKTVFAYIYWDKDDISLRKLFMDSPKVKLRGGFNLKNGLISSKLSAVFSRQFLEDSRKLKPLVVILGKDLPSVDFDFQLSGAPGAVNFKWLNSDFKERLYKKIPNFIRSSVEKDIEGVLRGLLAQGG